MLIIQMQERRFLGGTIEQNESPADAAIREACEETGIETFYDQCLLSNKMIDMKPYGRDETIDAWFYHLKTKERQSQRWRHAETSPSGGGRRNILVRALLGEPV